MYSSCLATSSANVLDGLTVVAIAAVDSTEVKLVKVCNIDARCVSMTDFGLIDFNAADASDICAMNTKQERYTQECMLDSVLSQMTSFISEKYDFKGINVYVYG